jgi:N-carbamoyl-L-amino-acid hydrolase
MEGVLEAYRDRPELAAFLELHIEQGPVLETEGLPIGVVETISGKRYYLASFIGRATHAGTTPLELRQDAFLALADFTLRATRHVAAEHYGSMITVGKVALHPGAFSVVAGRADFTLDFRSATQATLVAMEKEIKEIAEDVASTRGVKFGAKLADATEPVAIPDGLLALLDEESARLGYPRMRVTSGAGHDAQILSAVCESGMIFIPCLDGISHAPEESVSFEDLEKGANLLLAALLRLAG